MGSYPSAASAHTIFASDRGASRLASCDVASRARTSSCFGIHLEPQQRSAPETQRRRRGVQRVRLRLLHQASRQSGGVRRRRLVPGPPVRAQQLGARSAVQASLGVKRVARVLVVRVAFFVVARAEVSVNVLTMSSPGLTRSTPQACITVSRSSSGSSPTSRLAAPTMRFMSPGGGRCRRRANAQCALTSISASMRSCSRARTRRQARPWPASRSGAQRRERPQHAVHVLGVEPGRAPRRSRVRRRRGTRRAAGSPAARTPTGTATCSRRRHAPEVCGGACSQEPVDQLGGRRSVRAARTPQSRPRFLDPRTIAARRTPRASPRRRTRRRGRARRAPGRAWRWRAPARGTSSAKAPRSRTKTTACPRPACVRAAQIHTQRVGNRLRPRLAPVPAPPPATPPRSPPRAPPRFREERPRLGGARAARTPTPRSRAPASSSCAGFDTLLVERLERREARVARRRLAVALRARVRGEAELRSPRG